MPRLAVLWPLFVVSTASSLAAELDPQSAPDHWMRLGGFRGSASSAFGQEIRDALFGIEQDGDLYEDLGNLSLGVEIEEGDFEGEWKNSFHRQIHATHENLLPGSTVTPDDLSAYVDSQGMISRFRLKYESPEKVTGDLVLGSRAERGYTLTLARKRQPLVFGDRPLDEVLAERSVDNFQQIARRGKGEPTDVLELTGAALSGLARWIAQGTSSSVDSERGEIFFEDAADPLTLYWDVGIPVPLEMFTAADTRLSVGDRIRQATFASVSPLTAGIEESGVEISYETFFRFLRETTLTKEPDNQVLVTVQHRLLDGLEFRPLKVRPEIRFLRIVKLAYTFFEHRYNRGRTASHTMVYRIDLNDPEGVEALTALLGEGTDVQFRPMTAAADRGDGAELLFKEQRRGKRRLRSTRMRLIGPFRFDDRRTLFLDDVASEGTAYRELGLARTRRLRKRIGRDRDWSKQFLIRTLGDPPRERTDQGAGAPGTVAVELVTGLRSRLISAPEIADEADRLALTLGGHPVLDLLCSPIETSASDFFVSLRVSFGPEHLRHFREVPEKEVWRAIASILLAPEHADEWETPARRKLWHRRSERMKFVERTHRVVDILPQPTREPLSLRKRFKLAQRTMRKYRRLREMFSKSDCINCLSDALGREKDVLMQQILLFQLAVESGVGEPGYSYEIFGEPLLSPVTVTNDVRYGYEIAAPSLEEVIGEQASFRRSEAEEAIDRAGASRQILSGARTLVKASDSRLRAADLYLELPTDPFGAHLPVRLRLFSDYRFDPSLALRIDTRRSRVLAGDIAESVSLHSLGEPAEIAETPFTSGRFAYDVLVPPVAFEPGVAYTLLLRVLNPDGYPVSEEQQVRFTWPTDKDVAEHRAGMQGDQDL